MGFFELTSKNYFSSRCSVKVQYFKIQQYNILCPKRKDSDWFQVSAAWKALSWIYLPLTFYLKARSYYDALDRTCSQRKFKCKISSVQIILNSFFTIAWEASVSPGEKTTLKFSLSCFSLSDHSGFKLETAEINKQARKKKQPVES